MKILHVCRGLANSSGTTHIVRHLCEEQARLGEAVTVFHVEKRGGPAVLPDPERVQSRCFSLDLPISNLGYSRGLARALKESILDFDIVHIHAIWNFPTYATMKCAALAGVPYIVAPQGSLEPWAMRLNRTRKAIWAGLFERRWFDRAACMQALSANEVQQMRSYGIRSEAATIPNGVDMQLFARNGRFRDFRAEWEIPADDRVLLFLSRIHPKKGLEILAEAFARALRTMPNLTLLIAGSDAGSGYMKRVRECFEKAGAASKTRFLGEVRDERKLQALWNADAFVLPSHSEGLPVALLEAMAASLPVIATPGCNVPEIVEHHAGFVVQPTADAVADAILAVFRSDQERRAMAIEARRLIENRFNWPAIASQTLELYRRIIQ